jgi:hypothetical protein
MGLTLAASVRSLRASVWENQAFWHGTSEERTTECVRAEYDGLFYPQDSEWQQNALSLAAQALSGILHAEGFLGTSVEP